uniref:Retrovirus-related Pol polyprotein from transposon TNT 1-94 n=1 Tax=Tanacetum cinerariifolium TaxID=118510 RepID=A0A6L2NS89_TANCI|nr:retrovirus-related Pol polyprotein from transposon TNT 1-94 [Tanacetum cinerariifolium]
MKVEESLNVTFDESSPPTRLSPLVDDDVGKEEAIRKNTKVVNNNNEEDESIKVDEFVNIKESKNLPLDQVIGNLNQRTLSAFLNGFINEEVYVAQSPRFIDLQNQTMFINLKRLCMVLSKLLRLDIIFGSTSQSLCDDFAKIMHDEFEMSMMGELNFFMGLQIKQMEDRIFVNQSKYIKEMLKKFRLEDSKPTKTPMATKIKLTKDDKADSVDSSKYRGRDCPIRDIEPWRKHPKADILYCEFLIGEITKQINQMDYNRTKEYLPRVHRSRQMDEDLRESYHTLEKCLFHEGRFVTTSFIEANNMLLYFQTIGLEPFLTLNEPICPRFVVKFYHGLEVKRDEEERPYIEFKLDQFTFKLTSSQVF